MISDEIVGFNGDSRKGEFVLYMPRNNRTFGLPQIRLGSSSRDIKAGYPNDHGIELASGRYSNSLGYFMIEGVKPIDTPYRSYIDALLRSAFTRHLEESQPVAAEDVSTYQPADNGKAEISLAKVAIASSVGIVEAVLIGLLNGKNGKK